MERNQRGVLPSADRIYQRAGLCSKPAEDLRHRSKRECAQWKFRIAALSKEPLPSNALGANHTAPPVAGCSRAISTTSRRYVGFKIRNPRFIDSSGEAASMGRRLSMLRVESIRSN